MSAIDPGVQDTYPNGLLTMFAVFIDYGMHNPFQVIKPLIRPSSPAEMREPLSGKATLLVFFHK
jgi:hypothetical protein